MFVNSKTVTLTVSLSAATIFLGTACKEDDEEGKPPPCDWIYTSNECTIGGGGADEVGDGDGEGDGAYEYCVAENKADVPRTLIQCNGSALGSISFVIKIKILDKENEEKNCAEILGSPDLCKAKLDFGLGFEPYEMSKVMACCDPEGSPEDLILRHCAADLVEQICLSIPEQLQSLLDDKKVPFGKNQVKELIKWLRNNRQQCYDSLYKPSADIPGVLDSASWLVNGGGNNKWPNLHGFEITMETGAVTTHWLPEDAENHVTCYDNDYNNTEVFETKEPVHPDDLNTYHLGDSFAAAIEGPTLPDGRRTSGEASSVSQSLCHSPWCSSLTVVVEQNSNKIVLGDLSIFARGPAAIKYGDMPIAVDRAAVRLFGTSLGAYTNFNDGRAYVIDAGNAQFQISGVVGDTEGIRRATNVTPLVVRPADGGWTIDSFTIAHDDAGEIWTVTIPQTTWN